MQKTFDALVLQFNGEPWKNDKAEPLTVGYTIVQSLLASFPDEQGMPAEQKLVRYVLAERIHNAGTQPTEVTAENIALLKACVAKAYPIGVVGFVFQYLERDAPPARLRAVEEKSVHATS